MALSAFLRVCKKHGYVSAEQLAAARAVDLLTYLQRHEPEELVHISGGTYSTRTHDSLKISNGKWCWWSRGIGGTNALDYLVTVRGLSLPNAVEQIMGTAGYVPQPAPPPAKSDHTKQFVLPPNTPMTGMFFHTFATGALTWRSSTTVSSTGSSMRTPNTTTVSLKPP